MVTWDLLDEPWDALGDWTKTGDGISEISPPGQLHQQGTGLSQSGRTKTLAGGLPTQYTFESRLKIDGFNGYRHLYDFYDGEHLCHFRITATAIWLAIDLGYEKIDIDTDEGIFYIWRFVINSSGHSVKIYRNSQYVGEFTNIKHDASNDGKIETSDLFSCESHEDYFKIASGLHIPVLPEYIPGRAVGIKVLGKAKALPVLGQGKGDHQNRAMAYSHYVFSGFEFDFEDGFERTLMPFSGKRVRSSFKSGRGKVKT